VTEEDRDRDRPEGYADEGKYDDQEATFLEETFESSPNEPDPPSFDATSGEDLVNRLPAESDVSTEVKQSFWAMVVLLKIALLALSLGAMLAYFRGQFWIAAGLGFLGIFAAVRLYLRIREFGED
jgi:hypothetical protein